MTWVNRDLSTTVSKDLGKVSVISLCLLDTQVDYKIVCPPNCCEGGF